MWPALAIALAALSLMLLPASPAHSDAAPKAGGASITVSAGYSGYAVPLPDYAARVLTGGGSPKSSANLVYADISLAPIRIHLNESRAGSELEVLVRNRASGISLPPAAAFLIEPTAELPSYISVSGNGESASRVIYRLQVAMAAEDKSDYYLPIQLYQASGNVDSTTLQIKVLLDGESAGQETVELFFLPRGKVYSCLVEPEGRGLLEGDALNLTKGNPADPRLGFPGFLQEHALLSVAPDDLGPDFRVLRHFAFVVISAKTWSALSQRERTLLVEAAAMGSRLVVYGATKELPIGNVKCVPQPGLSLNSFGFGEVAVCAENLASLRFHLAAQLRRRLYYASKLAFGGAAEELGESAQRDLNVRGVMGGLNRGYSWIGYLAALPQSEGSVNPIWAYDYITRAGLLHPMDARQLRWYSRLSEDAGAELIARSHTDFPPLHWYLSNEASRNSRPYGSAIALYTLLALALTVFLSAYRRSYLWLIPALLALTALAVVLISFGVGTDAKPKALVLSSSLTSYETDTEEVRNVIYLTSAGALEIDVGLSSSGFALGHIAPLDASEAVVSAGTEGNVVLENLPVAPLIPQEVSYSEASVKPPSVSHAWRTLAEGGRELTLTVSEPLSFAFLVDGSRALYLGRLSGERSRSVVLPSEEVEVRIEQVRSDAIAAGLALLAYSADRRRKARAAPGGERLDLASRFLSNLLLHEAVRTLVAEGRGVTLLGLRFGEFRLTLDGAAVYAPRAELAVYRLK